MKKYSLRASKVPRGLTAERQWRPRADRTGTRARQYSRPERTHRRKAMETRTGSAWADHPKAFGGPERTHRRKAMETPGHRVGQFVVGFRASREDSPPKGNGDNGNFRASRVCGVNVPRGLTAERQWRHRVTGHSDRTVRWSREDSPPKGNGDLRPCEDPMCPTRVPRGLTAERQWRRPNSLGPDGISATCPERTHRRKAMETAILRGDPLRDPRTVPRGLTAERQWRLGAIVLVSYGWGRPERTHRRKAMETALEPDNSLEKPRGPERTHRRKAMETGGWVRDFRWRAGCPERTHRRKAMETMMCKCWSRGTPSPERTHRRKAMETVLADVGHRRSP